MNKFDEKYDIRFAEYDEIDDVMQFIDTYWKKGHILATDRAFFEYEHVIDGHVNFLIAREKETGMIHGILGFLPASDNKEKYDIWGVVWQTIDIAMPMLGIEMKKRLKEYTHARTELGVGANPKTSVPMLRMLLHYKTGKMKHFYCLAPKKSYRVAKVAHYEPLAGDPDYQVQVSRLNSMEELKQVYDFKYNEDMIPYKNTWYVNRRYFQHPVYQYQVYGLSEAGETRGVLICREQECNGTAVLRIVDYLGEPELFGGISEFLREKLKKYEYIDCYCYGFDTAYMKQAGMIEREEDDSNIIPNYFAPYAAQNIDIWVDSSSDGCVFFKADGDQDRPS